jgi:hypothetical protein
MHVRLTTTYIYRSPAYAREWAQSHAHATARRRRMISLHESEVEESEAEAGVWKAAGSFGHTWSCTLRRIVFK